MANLLKQSKSISSVIHRKGADNIVPDALSRIEVALPNNETVASTPLSNDKWYFRLFKNGSKYLQKVPNYFIKEGQLYCEAHISILKDYAWKLVVPLKK